MTPVARFALAGLAAVTLAGSAEAMPVVPQRAAAPPIVEAAVVVTRVVRRPPVRVVRRPRVVITKKVIR